MKENRCLGRASFDFSGCRLRGPPLRRLCSGIFADRVTGFFPEVVNRVTGFFPEVVYRDSHFADRVTGFFPEVVYRDSYFADRVTGFFPEVVDARGRRMAGR